MILLSIDPHIVHKTEAHYVFDVLLNILGYPYRRIPAGDESVRERQPRLHYGPDSSRPAGDGFLIHICAFEKAGPRIRRLKRSAVREDLPAGVLSLYTGEQPGDGQVWYTDEISGAPLITSSGSRLLCNADLVRTVFDFVTLAGERRIERRDPYGRFLRRYSPEGVEFYGQAAVDRIAQLLRVFIEHAGAPPALDPWPESRRFALVLTHDVDRIRTWTWRKVRRARQAGTPAAVLLRSLLAPSNWCGNFSHITKMENDLGGCSSFFFSAAHRVRRDPGYSPRSIRVQRGMAEIFQRGGSVGLHGSIPSAVDGAMLAGERMALQRLCGSTVRSGRQHYLRFEGDRSWIALEASGLQYDSTLGFADEPGYRCGTSYPFHPYDSRTSTPHRFWEIPLILMDTVLFLESKLSLRAERAWELVLSYLQEARSNRGCLTVNWHNSNVSVLDGTGYSDLYQRMLRWAAEHGGWLCSLEQCGFWWSAREEKLKSLQSV